MSKVMEPVELIPLLKWINDEYEHEKSIFGITERLFYQNSGKKIYRIWDEEFTSPLGLAAGPHTQCAQNIAAGFLAGARFFELKTVQILDEIEVDKPCIDADYEGYNTEWSTELTVQQAYEEYIKAWFLLHFLQDKFKLSPRNKRGFIFNMSVGYDLKGIKSKKIDDFINKLMQAENDIFFQKCRHELIEFYGKDLPVSSQISQSITLSTMHGCPPEEQERICRYLLQEKGLHTYVKLNPTLLGYDTASTLLKNNGYELPLKEESFTNDLQFEPALKMIKNLRRLAAEKDLTFGVKLSNTLPVINKRNILPGDEMYMSGKALYSLTINLASALVRELGEDFPVSYCGGAEMVNLKGLISSGMLPVTMATNLLKPGGYGRLHQMNSCIEELDLPTQIDSIYLNKQAKAAGNKKEAENFEEINRKSESFLPLWDCVFPSCASGCPLNQNIPQYIREIRDGNYKEALKTIMLDNPLPHVTGHICEQPCRTHCLRMDYEEALQIRELKKEAAEKGFADYLPEIGKVKANGIKAAVIGAGPSGLAAAYFLQRNGIKAHVYEKEAFAGGLVRHVIPSFRLPDAALENDLKMIRAVGVKVFYNQDKSVTELVTEGYNYIIVATGAPISKNANLAGDKENLISGIEFLRKCRKDEENVFKAKKVIVFGGGNSAMDSARMSKRLIGVQEVILVYRRTAAEMPADKEEFYNALKEGIKWKELLQPVRLDHNTLYFQPMERGEEDAKGRRSVHPSGDEDIAIKADLFISAIGEEVDKKFLEDNHINLIKGVNTDRKNVFITGDACRGPSSVVQAMADGKKAAYEIIKRENIPIRNHKKNITGAMAADLMKKKAEIFLTESCWQADKEAERCLECDLICQRCVEVCPNRANIALKFDSELFKDSYQIIHLDKLCNECGNCETFCPYSGAPYKDKFTLFSSLKSFKQSSSDGIFLDKNFSGRYRYQSKTSLLEKEIPADISVLINILKTKYSYLLEL